MNLVTVIGELAAARVGGSLDESSPVVCLRAPDAEELDADLEWQQLAVTGHRGADDGSRVVLDVASDPDVSGMDVAAFEVAMRDYLDRLGDVPVFVYLSAPLDAPAGSPGYEVATVAAAVNPDARVYGVVQEFEGHEELFGQG